MWCVCDVCVCVMCGGDDRERCAHNIIVSICTRARRSQRDRELAEWPRNVARSRRGRGETAGSSSAILNSYGMHVCVCVELEPSVCLCVSAYLCTKLSHAHTHTHVRIQNSKQTPTLQSDVCVCVYMCITRSRNGIRVDYNYYSICWFVYESSAQREKYTASSTLARMRK